MMREEAGTRNIVLGDMFEENPDGNLPGTLGRMACHRMFELIRYIVLHHTDRYPRIAAFFTYPEYLGDPGQSPSHYL